MPVARVLALFWLLALKQLSKRRRVLASLFWPFMSLFLPLLSTRTTTPTGRGKIKYRNGSGFVGV